MSEKIKKEWKEVRVIVKKNRWAWNLIVFFLSFRFAWWVKDFNNENLMLGLVVVFALIAVIRHTDKIWSAGEKVTKKTKKYLKKDK